jgi:hypothetical protein
MSIFKLWTALAVATILAGCATEPGLLTGSIPPHITKVTVAKSSLVGSVNMAEDLRVKILQRAPAYAAAGTAKTLDVQIKDVNFKNPLATILIGDSNRVSVVVRVLDGATGKVDASYDAIAIDQAAINGIAGAVMAAADDPIDVEQRLTEAAASLVLTRLYGTESAQRAAQRPIDSKVVSQYPRSYVDLKTEARCKTLADANAASAANKNDAFHGKTGPLPTECAGFGTPPKAVAKRA